jgi:hypothetical protein
MRKPKRVVIDEEIKVYPMFPEDNRSARIGHFVAWSMILFIVFALLAIMIFVPWIVK